MEAKDSSKKATAKNTTAKNTTPKKTNPKKTNPKKTKIEYIDELDISQELLNESKALTLYDPKVLVNTSKAKPENLAIETIVRKDKLSIEVGSKPSSADLQEIVKDDKHYFNFNNKAKSTYIECYNDEEYFIEFYKKFGKPEIYGLYEKNSDTNYKKIIGVITLICRYDTKVCHIMDMKIRKQYRGIGGISKFIMATLLNRLFKYNGYYGITMNNNTIVESLSKKIMMPTMKNRGKMLIYLVSYDEINKILPILSSFYCSEISFIDNNKSRLFVDSTTNKAYKLLHLNHNAEYLETFDFDKPKPGYQYCFSIHESSEFMIQELQEKYKIGSSSSATVYSNDFKPDWSKFVKTFEI
jgi:hypothetical protein